MIVVGDAGPLLYLGATGRIGLLRDLFGTVVVTPEVIEEVVDPAQELPGAAQVAAAEGAGWLVRRALGDGARLRDALLAELDGGEASAIALASELGADLLLIDDRRGREVARRMSLAVKGTLGVLIEARDRGLLERLAPAIGELREAGLWVTDDVVARVLALVGETPADSE